MDVDINTDQNIDQDLEDDRNARKNRIHMYKNILNYYRGRSLSLDFILASRQANLNVTPDMKTHEALSKDIQCLHDDITLIQSVKNCLKLINCSLASTEIMSTNYNVNRDCINKIEGIIYFSKSIMKLYNECCTELEMIQKMKNYSVVLTKYINNLHKLKENEKNVTTEDSKEMEKAELHIYKINLMRTMKSVLIGYISVNCPDLLSNIQKFKSSLRRDLTVDDFRNTWDVGLPSDTCVPSCSSN